MPARNGNKTNGSRSPLRDAPAGKDHLREAPKGQGRLRESSGSQSRVRESAATQGRQPRRSSSMKHSADREVCPKCGRPNARLIGRSETFPVLYLRCDDCNHTSVAPA
jgi:hypothetical protein